MKGASFEVRLGAREAYGPSGGDEVEFMIAPNPGVPPGPLRDTASGGELSRVMLALMSVAAVAGPGTLVFDEVDAGVGGQTARTVGQRLRALGEARQVLCITHLPQIAACGRSHFLIEKKVQGRRTVTSVNRLTDENRVEEIARMMGGAAAGRKALESARELLDNTGAKGESERRKRER